MSESTQSEDNENVQGAIAEALFLTSERIDEQVSVTVKGSLPPLEVHVKARGQDNPSYPPRQLVPDELVPWGMQFPDYSPEAWTHGDVLANDRELSTGHKWADPPDVARAGLAQRVSFAGDGLPKPLVLSADGRRVGAAGRHPAGRRAH